MKIVKHNNIELHFDEEKHIYTVDNIPYISVTTKIGDFAPKFDTQRESFKYSIAHNTKQSDVIKMWSHEAAVGCEFGSSVHLYAENYLLKKELPYPDNEKEEIYFEVVKKWLKQFLKYFEIVDVEKIIFSPQYKISGTFDLFVKNKRTGKYYILDWKSNKKVTYKNTFQNCLHPFEKYQATDIIKFQMQLNLYYYIMKIEKYIKNIDIGLKILYITANGIRIINIDKFNEEQLKHLIGG